MRYPIDELDAEFTTLLADITSIEYPFYCNDSAEIVDRVMKAKGIKSRQQDRLSHRADLSRFLHQARLIKSQEEVDVMREAGRISALGHLAAMRACQPGMRGQHRLLNTRFVWRASSACVPDNRRRRRQRLHTITSTVLIS